MANQHLHGSLLPASVPRFPAGQFIYHSQNVLLILPAAAQHKFPYCMFKEKELIYRQYSTPVMFKPGVSGTVLGVKSEIAK